MNKAFNSMVQEAGKITRDDLATFLCLNGWIPLNEAGRSFKIETDTHVLEFDLGTCHHDTCFVRDLVVYQELRSLQGCAPLTLPALVDHVQRTVSAELSPASIST